MASSNNHFLSDFIKDKTVKILLKILLILIVLYAVYAFLGVIFGYRVKFFPNQQKAKTDTVYITSPITEPTNANTKGNVNTSTVYVPVPSKNTNSKQIDTTPKIVGKNVNTGTNSGIVGDVTVNNGMAQRHLTEDYKKMLLKRITDTLNANGLTKNVSIKFGSTMGSNEAFEFTKEVMNYLNSVGFTNISNGVGASLNNDLLVVYIDKVLHIDVGMKQ